MSIHIFSNSDPRAHLHCAFNLYEATLEKLISEVSIKGKYHCPWICYWSFKANALDFDFKANVIICY